MAAWQVHNIICYISMYLKTYLGMVSVCAGCDGYYPWAAALVAAVSGCLYVIVSKLVVSIKVDDPLDAVAVHAGSGLWGILAAPIFMDTGQLFCMYTFINCS